MRHVGQLPRIVTECFHLIVQLLSLHLLTHRLSTSIRTVTHFCSTVEKMNACGSSRLPCFKRFHAQNECSSHLLTKEYLLTPTLNIAVRHTKQDTVTDCSRLCPGASCSTSSPAFYAEVKKVKVDVAALQISSAGYTPANLNSKLQLII